MAPPRRLRRRLSWIAALVVAAWLAAGHGLVRPALRGWIDDHFEGRCTITTAIVWPHLDVTAFGVDVQADHHALHASRVGVGFRVLGLFGGRLVEDVDIAGLRAEFDEGEPVALFRSGDAEGEERDAAADGGPPGLLPPIRFDAPRLRLRGDGAVRELLRGERAELTQEGERRYRLELAPGALATVPFERLSAHVVPRAGHLIVSDFKLNAFRGMFGGMVDVDTAKAGAFNGEIEWRFVEIERIWEHYGLPYREKRRGDLSGRVVFEGDRPALDALRGTGTLELSRGAFYSPVSFKMFLVLDIPSLEEAKLTRGTMSYSFEKRLVYLESCEVYGRAFEWEAQGIVSFAGRADMEIRHGNTTVAVSGPLDDPSVSVLPFNTITAPFARMFRERVEEAR